MSDINGLHRDSELKNQDLAASRGQKEAHRARMHTAEHGLDLTVVKPGILLVIWCQVRSMDKNMLVVQLYQLSGPDTLVLLSQVTVPVRSLKKRPQVSLEPPLLYEISV